MYRRFLMYSDFCYYISYLCCLDKVKRSIVTKTIRTYLTRCYTQNVLRPYIDSKINHKVNVILSKYVSLIKRWTSLVCLVYLRINV